MFTGIECIILAGAIWYYAVFQLGNDFVTGTILAIVLCAFTDVMIGFTKRNFKALYVLIALAMSGGWAWIGYTFAPLFVTNEPRAPLYGAAICGIGSILGKLGTMNQQGA